MVMGLEKWMKNMALPMVAHLLRFAGGEGRQRGREEGKRWRKRKRKKKELGSASCRESV